MQTVKVSQGGRLVIPAELRELLDIKQGDELLMEAREGELVITSKRRRLLKIQAECQQLLVSQPGQSVVDQLLADRRKEAAKDEAETKEWLDAIKKRGT